MKRRESIIKACVHYFKKCASWLFVRIKLKSEPTNQAQIKISIATGLKMYLNYFKKYLATFQVFKLHIAILWIFGNYRCILNKCRIVSQHCFAKPLVKVWNIIIDPI